MNKIITPEVGDVWLYKYNEFKTEYYISAIASYECPEYYVFLLYIKSYFLSIFVYCNE